MYIWYVQMNTFLLIYFRVVGSYSHCMCGTLSQCMRSGVMPPLDPKLLVWGRSTWSWKIFIKQIQNFNIFKNKHNSIWSVSSTNLWTKNLSMARQSSPSVVNSWPMIVACRSHAACSFVHSTMMTGYDIVHYVFCWCQPRLVNFCSISPHLCYWKWSVTCAIYCVSHKNIPHFCT